MKIVIRLKSGFELPITCEEFNYGTSRLTGEVETYSIKGIEDNKPLYIKTSDIECIYRKVGEE